MDRRINPSPVDERPPPPRAATVAEDGASGELAVVTLNGGDGTTVRGPYIGRVPQAGDIAAVWEDDEGNPWITSWPAP